MTDFETALRTAADMVWKGTDTVRGGEQLTRMVRNSEGKYGRSGFLKTTTLSYTPAQRLRALSIFFAVDAEAADDALSRVRDALKHTSGKELIATQEFISQVALDETIPSRIRTETAVFLFNSSFFHLCYPAFEKICLDESTEVEWQVEAARFLYVSGDFRCREISQGVILGIIDSDSYPSEYKYRVIASFIRKTGVASFFNGLVRTTVDINFIHGLQTTFFFNAANSPSERILSGQWILQNATEDEEKTEISMLLEKISSNEALPVSTRADAADVLINLGFPEEVKTAAMQLITALGDEGGGHVFSNSQNVHHAAIAESVESFIFKLVAESEDVIPEFKDVFPEVTRLVKTSALPEDSRKAAYRALNRLSVDSATYTRLRVPICDIFVHVWVRIQNWEKEAERAELEKRLVEELIEMAETCSSGHAARLINALATYDFQLRIGFDDQVASNISGRMDARTRKLLEEDPDGMDAEALSLGLMTDGTTEQRERILKVWGGWLKEIYAEMHKEFVGGGYLAKSDFESLFRAHSFRWTAPTWPAPEPVEPPV